VGALVLVLSAGSAVPEAPASPRSPCGHDGSVSGACRVVAPSTVTSPDGQYSLELFGGGDLVLVDAFHVAVWSDRVTKSAGPGSLELEPDGDLVVFGATGTPVWSSRTAGSGATSLAVQDDGNLTLVGPTGAEWSSRSGSPLVAGHEFREVVTVTSGGPPGSMATLTAFQWLGGSWQPRFPPSPAWVGERGWSTPSERREGDGTTPEGTYPIVPTLYGTDPRPGVRLAYRRVRPGDYWDENPATGRRYNTFQSTRDDNCRHNPFGGDTECLWLEGPATSLFAVIGFNTPERGPFGSAIFVHAGTASTQGCVAVPAAILIKVLTWFDPGERPTVVLAGTRHLSTVSLP
jgi:L,D-peptidoglycan transpeptidase YkuD (ErfK/YbiS/YcfS/YnhG family)